MSLSDNTISQSLVSDTYGTVNVLGPLFISLFKLSYVSNKFIVSAFHLKKRANLQLKIYKPRILHAINNVYLNVTGRFVLTSKTHRKVTVDKK